MRYVQFLFTLATGLGLADASSTISFLNLGLTDTTMKVENTNASGPSVGVSGRSSTPAGIGVAGMATGSGATVGVRGYSKSSTGFGVHGTNDAGGKGVTGVSTISGHGVYGEAMGVSGIGIEGRATHVNGFYGVRGVGPSIGVYGTTLSSTGEGVRGKSIDSVGVMAISTYGNAMRATTTSGIGVYGTSTNGVGVKGEGATFGVYGKGGYFSATGVYGDADLGYGVSGYSLRNFGVTGTGSNGVQGAAYYNGNGYPVGVSGYANAYDNTQLAFGIIGYAEGATHESWAGYFDGNVAISGECSPCVISDASTKKNIQPLKASLSRVLAMKPKSYEMKTAEFSNRMKLAEGPQNGLIAQELELIVPEAVHSVTAPPRYTEDEMKSGVVKKTETLKAVNYAALIPILIAAIQEQQAEIEALKAGR